MTFGNAIEGESRLGHIGLWPGELVRLATVVAALVGLLSFAGPACADTTPAPTAASSQAAPEHPPTTTTDPGVALDDLEIMLEPMTRSEVEIEAKAWFALLRAKVSEISVAELAVHHKNREIAQLAKEKAAGEALAQAAKDAKSQQSSADTTAADKAAAAERLVSAQKDLVATMNTAQEEAASDQKKAAAVASVASEKTEEAAKVSSATGPTVPATGDVTELVASNSQNASQAGSAPDLSASVEKEASAASAAKSLEAEIPAAAGNTATPVSTDQATSKAEEFAAKAKEATGAKTEVKVALVDLSTKLASEKTALADRLKLVLDKWEVKGGDPTEYRQYVASLSGFKIDVTDQTATWARTKAWLVADEGGLRWSRNLAIFLGYVLGSVIIAWIVRKALRRAMRVTNVSSNLLRDFVVAMSGRAIVFFGFLLGLSALEINLSPILAAVGAAGFVIAFALQGTLSNFASGLLIMVNKPFDVGDTVEIGSGIKSKVDAVTIFSTVVETEDGLTMIVPNNTVWSGVIINHSTSTVSNATEEAKTA